MPLTDLALRLLLLVVSVLLLYYFSNRNRVETMNPLLMLVALCTFSLCYLFTKIEVGIGIGFGLFAIFSILRFRTKAFNINVIIFLFSSITLSILDMMYPPGDFGALILFQSAIIVAYGLCTLKVIRYINSIELTLDYAGPDAITRPRLETTIREQIGCDRFDFKIESVDAKTRCVKVKVFF